MLSTASQTRLAEVGKHLVLKPYRPELNPGLGAHSLSLGKSQLL